MRLYVPVNEFEFNSFFVPVRRLASRSTRRQRGEFPVIQHKIQQHLCVFCHIPPAL
jgi:hypothetical protein